MKQRSTLSFWTCYAVTGRSEAPDLPTTTDPCERVKLGAPAREYANVGRSTEDELKITSVMKEAAYSPGYQPIQRDEHLRR